MSIDPTNDNKGAQSPGLLGNIIEEIMRQDVDKKDTISVPSAPSDSVSASATPDLLSALLSNPELITKLPAILSAIKPIMEAIGKQSAQLTKGGSNSEQPVSLFEKNSKSFGNDAPASAHKQESDRRAALLCAIKPYLCRDRQNAIDYIIKLSHLGDILRSL